MAFLVTKKQQVTSFKKLLNFQKVTNIHFV